MQAVRPSVRKASVSEKQIVCVCLRLTAVRGGQVFSCCRFLRADTGVNIQRMMSRTRQGGQTTHKVKLSFHTDLLNIKTICCPTGLVYQAGCLRSRGPHWHSDLGDLDLCEPQFLANCTFLHLFAPHGSFFWSLLTLAPHFTEQCGSESCQLD